MIFYAIASLATLAVLVPTSYSAPVDTGSCTVNNQTYANGEIFHCPENPMCIKYKCVDGSASLYEEGCNDNGVCRLVDSTWVFNCRIKLCSKITQGDLSTYSISTASSECTDAYGECKSPGDTFSYKIGDKTYTQCSCTIDEDQAVKYSCNDLESLGSLGSCTVNNQTYANGEIFTPAGFPMCIKYKCVEGSASVYEEGCNDNGVCRLVDSTWVVNCKTKMCSKITQGDLSTYSISTASSKCTDANGECKLPGDTFSYKIGDKTYTQCSCTIDEAQAVKYSCNDPVASCTVNNQTYANGEIFTPAGFPMCIKYKCVDGSAGVYEEGCSDNGVCRPVDSTWVINCGTKKCSKTTQGNLSTFSISIASLQCTDANGVCRSPGEEFPYKIGSTTYPKCSCTIDAAQTVKYSCNDPVASCTVNNQTFANGEIFTPAGFPMCIKYKCVDGSAGVYEEGCNDNGVCRPLDSTWVNNCNTKKCSKIIQGDLSTYSISIASSQCTDANGVCRSPGEEFPYKIGSTTYPKCSCTIDAAQTVKYSCNDPGSSLGSCTVNNQTYANGAIFTPAGFPMCIKYKCVDGSASVYEEGCNDNGVCRPVDSTWVVNCRTKTCSKITQGNLSTYSISNASSQCTDANGVCRSPGEEFPYKIGSTTYTKCSCTIDAAQTVRYSCSG